jgi:hypothetical protein
VMAAVGKVEEIVRRADKDIVVRLALDRKHGNLVFDRSQQTHDSAVFFEEYFDDRRSHGHGELLRPAVSPRLRRYADRLAAQPRYST